MKRQWQLLENQVKYDIEQKEKAEKEAAAQAGEMKKSKAEGSDSDEDMARGDAGKSCLLFESTVVLLSGHTGVVIGNIAREHWCCYW